MINLSSNGHLFKCPKGNCCDLRVLIESVPWFSVPNEKGMTMWSNCRLLITPNQATKQNLVMDFLAQLGGSDNLQFADFITYNDFCIIIILSGLIFSILP